jgi:hypothetical protein
MSKASGFVLLVAGLSAAAYVVLPSGIDTGEPELPPHFTDVAKIPPPSGASEVALAAPEPQAVAQATTPVAIAREPAPMPSFSAPVVVTLGQRPSEPSLPSPHRAGPGPRDRDAIGRELQKELKRVGCYEGELNGAWTPSTRQAMKAFTDRVNATLPTDEPDSILLTLVQAYQDKVCGKPCPAGQGLSDIGRCVPTAILARAAKKGAPAVAAAPPAEKPTPAITSWSTTTTAAAPTPPTAAPPTEGRMALAGPTAPEATPPPGTPPPGATPPPAASPPVAAKERRPPKVSEGWARNVFRNQQSLN